QPEGHGAEGYIAFFLVSVSGSTVQERRMSNGEGSVTFSLPPGSHYELFTYVRDCDANCGKLDPSEDECRAPFTVKARETLYARRLPMVGALGRRRCKITFSSSALK